MKNKPKKIVGDLVQSGSPKRRPAVPREKIFPAGKIAFSRLGSKIGLVAAALIFVLLVSATFVFLALPEATIAVKSRVEPVTRDLEIRVDADLNEIDASGLAIPGKLIKEDLSADGSFAASGSKNAGETASGFVQIYNFSKTTLILRAGTTTLKAGGRKYFFTQDVANIRPTAFIGLEEQEIYPSSLIAPVPVVAEAPGGIYNLGAGVRIEIDNEVFGERPNELYAAAGEGGISGGSDRILKVVSEADILTAYNELESSLVGKAEAGELASFKDQKVLESAVETRVIDQAVSAAPGSEQDSFNASMVLELHALTFREDDLLELTEERIRRLLPENKVLNDSGGNWRLEARFMFVNLEESEGLLRVHYESRIEYTVDEAGIRETVRGKTADEIGELLLSKPEIIGVKIDFFPFWVKKAPRLSKKIKITVEEE